MAHNGRHPVCLVTSVLDPLQRCDSQVIELYRICWGVELFYRHFKQSFGRHQPQSHRAETAEVQAVWSMAGLRGQGGVALR